MAGRFGNAVGFRGDHAVVGDDWGGGGAAHQGAAYVYRRNGAGGWDLVLPILTAPDATNYDHFGRAVAIYEERLIVDAPRVTGAGVAGAGAAYVYVRAGTSWGLEQPAIPLERLRLERDWSRYADILFGVIRGGPGVIIKPGSGPTPVNPEPFVGWGELDRSLRDRVLGEALTRIADTIDDRKLRDRVAEVATAIAKKAEQQR